MAAAAEPAQQAEHLDEDAEPDVDELQALLLEDDAPEGPRAPVEAAAPGFTQFGQFSADFPPCQREARMEQGQEKRWDPQIHNFHVPIATASNYD